MNVAASMQTRVSIAEPGQSPRSTTLLELVREIAEVTEDDREVVATVVHLLQSGRVRLCGILRETPVDQIG